LEMFSVKGLGRLKVLDVSKNTLSSLDDIGRLENLEVLNLSDNRLLDIEGIETLVALKTIDVSNNDLEEAAGLSKLLSDGALTEEGIKLRNNQCTDLVSCKVYAFTPPNRYITSYLNKEWKLFSPDDTGIKAYVHLTKKNARYFDGAQTYKVRIKNWSANGQIVDGEVLSGGTSVGSIRIEMISKWLYVTASVNGTTKKYEYFRADNSLWQNGGSWWRLVNGNVENFYKGDISQVKNLKLTKNEAYEVHVEGNLRGGYVKLKFDLRKSEMYGEFSQGAFRQKFTMYRKLSR